MNTKPADTNNVLLTSQKVWFYNNRLTLELKAKRHLNERKTVISVPAS